MVNVDQYLIGGFNPSEKCQSIGRLFPIHRKMKNAPNHQPDESQLGELFQTCGKVKKLFQTADLYRVSFNFQGGSGILPEYHTISQNHNVK